MSDISSAQRSQLRAEAHRLDPVVMIGEAGLSAAVSKEIELALNAHGLIKIRVAGDDREQRIAIYDTICASLGAEPIQHIGKLLIVYRPKPELALAPKSTSGRGMRKVTIVKPSPSGTRRPTITKVMVKGNERVTAGGTIKRAKPRQTSVKKSALGNS